MITLIQPKVISRANCFSYGGDGLTDMSWRQANLGNINSTMAVPVYPHFIGLITVDYMEMATSSFSFLPLGLLRDTKSSLLKLQPNAQNHGIFPIGVILGLIMICAALYLSSPYRKLPPGPRGYPIIGNLLDLRSGQWLKFTEWRKTYGQFIPSTSWFTLKHTPDLSR
jgi:hypothetical protein